MIVKANAQLLYFNVKLCSEKMKTENKQRETHEKMYSMLTELCRRMDPTTPTKTAPQTMRIKTNFSALFQRLQNQKKSISAPQSQLRVYETKTKYFFLYQYNSIISRRFFSSLSLTV